MARPSDPGQAYKHLATNRDHIKRVDNARSASASAAGGPDDGGSDGGGDGSQGGGGGKRQKTGPTKYEHRHPACREYGHFPKPAEGKGKQQYPGKGKQQYPAQSTAVQAAGYQDVTGHDQWSPQSAQGGVWPANLTPQGGCALPNKGTNQIRTPSEWHGQQWQKGQSGQSPGGWKGWGGEQSVGKTNWANSGDADPWKNHGGK